MEISCSPHSHTSPPLLLQPHCPLHLPDSLLKMCVCGRVIIDFSGWSWRTTSCVLLCWRALCWAESPWRRLGGVQELTEGHSQRAELGFESVSLWLQTAIFSFAELQGPGVWLLIWGCVCMCAWTYGGQGLPKVSSYITFYLIPYYCLF